jgi:bla regulator protein BlaR1
MIAGLTNHLWQSTLFALAVALLTIAFRTNRAQLRYWLWFSASLKFFLPFALLMSLGSHLNWAPEAKKIATPVVSLAVDQIARPFPADPSFVPVAPAPIAWLPVAIFGIWTIGFAVIAVIRFRGWLQVRAAVRSSIPLQLPVAPEVDARLSPGLLEPGVVGSWRPILLLPDGIVERLTTSELETVLAHELCHVRRRDNLSAAIHMIVEAAFWFHPVVWWIGARLVTERERACDEDVLRLGNQPRVYAEAILNVCRLYAESPLACVSGVSGADIRQRIESIMAGQVSKNLNRARKALLAGACVVAVSAPIVIGLIVVPRGSAQSADSGQKFEVASIRLSACNNTGPASAFIAGNGGRRASTPGRVILECAHMRDVIQRAYGYPDPNNNPLRGQVLGGPGWLDSDTFDIEAKAEGTPPASQMQGPMMRALLEDRFRMKAHRETREAPVYELTAAKDGPKLHATKAGSCITTDGDQPPGQSELPHCGGHTENGHGFDLYGSTLANLCKVLSLKLDRDVIDKTGISGLFDIHLDLARDPVTPAVGTGAPNDADSIRPGDATSIVKGFLRDMQQTSDGLIIPALQQQLGMKLESAKGSAAFLVIDHIEKPTEN